jgi:chromosomal replication initiation ATPase DnaA
MNYPGAEHRLGDLVAAAAQAAMVPLAVMLSRQRGARLAAHRAAAMWLAANRRATLPQVGRAFGRDHTTVIHALRRVDAVIHGQAERDALLVMQEAVAIKWIAVALVARKQGVAE